ncbi:helix-turn-helix domain-containing protein [Candidatus Bathyarchaeota archaeon]|nr:helix-turn-helix domain-containing protein [Candidatus Bathyarchaeota archaeon]
MFKAVSSPTRLSMLRRILRGEIHVSALAREMGISVPVAARHIRILERAGLIEKKEFGRSQVLRAKPERLYEMLDAFADTAEVEVPSGKSVLDVLKATCAITTRRFNEKEFLLSIDGKEGFYLYEVNGKLGDKPINQYKLTENVKLKLKKLVPVTEKKINVKVR